MASDGHILIVEDEIVQRRMITAMVERSGFTAKALASGPEALALLRDKATDKPDVILLDQIMPVMNGIDVLREIKKMHYHIPVVMLTAEASLKIVVEAMRAGASDFIVKPASADRIQDALNAAIEGRSLSGNLVEDLAPKVPVGAKSPAAEGFKTLIGDSMVMRRTLKLGEKAAQSNIPVLIEGESGVGKEVLARAIHAESARAAQNFVAVNCGAIPENLVESILFGHEKGAFTGATEQRIGMFQQADGGTLFLDEVGELPLDIQVKLLRALQEREVQPVGGKHHIKVDIRIISATNRTLLEEVANGTFREDLFYRLNVFPLTLAPLRQRIEDVPALVNHLLQRIARSEGSKAKQLSANALMVMQAYDWPGNIRQLQNALFRAAILSEGDELEADDFPMLEESIVGKSEPVHGDKPDHADKKEPAYTVPGYNAAPHIVGAIETLGTSGHIRPLAAIERDHIRAALKRYDGRMAEVARRLDIGRSTLYRKVALYGLEDEIDP